MIILKFNWIVIALAIFNVTLKEIGCQKSEGSQSQNLEDFEYYNSVGEYDWSQKYPNCTGTRQSPINIDEDNVVRNKRRPILKIFSYDVVPTNMTIFNDGHTVQVKGTWPKQSRPRIKDGPLNGTYIFGKIHFHWGSNSDYGSEHSINNKTFSMEVHLIHYKEDYKDVDEASNHSDGLAVIGCLISVGKEKNIAIERMARKFDKIRDKGQSAQIKPFALSSLSEYSLRNGYYSYMGSLTTPPCSEVVTWLICMQERKVTEKELQKFRSLNLSNHDKHNYRPRQFLNNREVSAFASAHIA